MGQIIIPYEGSDPYIFVSYSHRDEDRVMSVVHRMQEDGYRVWYDEGIELGADWPESVAIHLRDCAVMLAFISAAFLDSHNCRKEIDYAVSKKKPMLYLLLEDVTFSPGMEMQLSTVQSFSIHKAPSDVFYRKLYASGLLLSCRVPIQLTEADIDNLTVPGDYQKNASKSSIENEPFPENKKTVFYETTGHQLKTGSMVRNRYKITQILGEGGFGITYLGEDTTLGIKVAIKEYFPVGIVYRTQPAKTVSMYTNEEAKRAFVKGKDRFLREARILARFSEDPFVVTVRDYFEENNTAYLIMEYVEGETLADMARKKGKLSQQEIMVMMLPVMETLSRIHEQGVIHRDISPANLISDGKHIKLLDFGAANHFDEDDERSFSVIMKPGYAPQEQYRRDSEQGPWTDIYALCATIYKLLTGELPQDALGRIVKDNVLPPSEMGIKVDKSFESALMKGLAVYPQNRYQSVNDMISDITAEKKTTHPEDSDVDIHDNNYFQKNSRTSGDNERARSRLFIPFIACAFVAIIAVLLLSRGNNSRPLTNSGSSNSTDQYENVENSAAIASGDLASSESLTRAVAEADNSDEQSKDNMSSDDGDSTSEESSTTETSTDVADVDIKWRKAGARLITLIEGSKIYDSPTEDLRYSNVIGNSNGNDQYLVRIIDMDGVWAEIYGSPGKTVFEAIEDIDYGYVKIEDVYDLYHGESMVKGTLTLLANSSVYGKRSESSTIYYTSSKANIYALDWLEYWPEGDWYLIDYRSGYGYVRGDRVRNVVGRVITDEKEREVLFKNNTDLILSKVEVVVRGTETIVDVEGKKESDQKAFKFEIRDDERGTGRIAVIDNNGNTYEVKKIPLDTFEEIKFSKRKSGKYTFELKDPDDTILFYNAGENKEDNSVSIGSDTFLQDQCIIVTGKAVNIRMEPSTNGVIIGVTQKGLTYNIYRTEKDAEGKDWYLIDFKGRAGYITSEFAELKN